MVAFGLFFVAAMAALPVDLYAQGSPIADKPQKVGTTASRQQDKPATPASDNRPKIGGTKDANAPDVGTDWFKNDQPDGAPDLQSDDTADPEKFGSLKALLIALAAAGFASAMTGFFVDRSARRREVRLVNAINQIGSELGRRRNTNSLVAGTPANAPAPEVANPAWSDPASPRLPPSPKQPLTDETDNHRRNVGSAFGAIAFESALPPRATTPPPPDRLPDLARRLTELAGDPAIKNADYGNLVQEFGTTCGIDLDADGTVAELSDGAADPYRRLTGLRLPGSSRVAILPSAKFVKDFSQIYKETLEAGPEVRAVYECIPDGRGVLQITALASGTVGPDGLVTSIVRGRLGGFVR